jgi:hypothetical protein
MLVCPDLEADFSDSDRCEAYCVAGYQGDATPEAAAPCSKIMFLLQNPEHPISFFAERRPHLQIVADHDSALLPKLNLSCRQVRLFLILFCFRRK